MVTSKTIAGLVGPTFVAVAAALLLNLGSISAVLEPLSRDPALVLIYGIFLFVAGLAIDNLLIGIERGSIFLGRFQEAASRSQQVSNSGADSSK